VEGAEHLPEDGCILVGNHCHMHGPITSELYVPGRHTTWCAAQMMELKEVPPYAYQDFWSGKPKAFRWFYRLLSYLIAPLSVLIFNHAYTIPVYHDQRLITTMKQTVAELEAWADKIRPIIDKAIKGCEEYSAGDHCRFCKAAPRCKALSDYNLELARLEFRDANQLTDEEIADVLGRIDSLKHYADMIAKYALQEAVAGRHKWPGFKLVEGRSRRVYKDPSAIMDILSEAGYTPDKFLKPAELIGVTDMTKLLTKKRFEELLGAYMDKPQGKPTLAPLTDKRPEFVPAADEFENLDD
jgi:hypothetical protein